MFFKHQGIYNCVNHILQLCTHQEAPALTAPTEIFSMIVCGWARQGVGARQVTGGVSTFFGGRAMIASFLWKNESKTMKWAECFPPVEEKKANPTTGKLKSSNRLIMHCWNSLEIMALVRLGPQIFTFLYPPGRTNEILWRASCLSLGWHWREQLYLYPSRVFCTAASFPTKACPSPDHNTYNM